ncbi:hypothetical protein ACOMHN_058100 [Nucella lapillus]
MDLLGGYMYFESDSEVPKGLLRTGPLTTNLFRCVVAGFQISFEGIKGQGGNKSDIALDDIRFRPNSISGPMPLPQSPTDCDFDIDLCGYTQLYPEEKIHRLWSRRRGPTPTSGSGPPEDSPLGYPGADTGHFRVGMKEEVSSKLTVLFSVYHDQGQGWNQTEIDFDLVAPSTLQFLATSRLDKARMLNNIGLDDVQVTDGTCKSVPFTEQWKSRCDRPTSRCVSGQGRCNTATLTCDCENGFTGLQCQSLTVHAECKGDKMIINVFPYGFKDLASWNIRYPETAATSCMLKPVSQVAAVSNRGWKGFAGEFLHSNDPCAGSAKVVADMLNPKLLYVWCSKQFSRQLRVYYEPLGRHPTDTLITVKCEAQKLPPPRLTVQVKELKPLKPNAANSGRRVLTYVDVFFALNIPNNEHMTEIKVMQCTASNGVRTVFLVRNGCAQYPVGLMLYDGKQMGTEHLLMQVFKRPSLPLTLTFKCRVYLCDARVDNFCYQRELCLGRGRKRRSVSLETEDKMKGGNTVEVEYTYTQTN